MKRKLEDANFPPLKRRSLTLYNSIRTNFLNLNEQDLEQLIEQLKDGMAFEDIFYLLKVISHKINEAGMNSLKEYKKTLSQLANLAFENIKISFAISDSTFKNWAYKQAANQISFLIYDLGIIATEFEVPILEAQDLQFMMNVLFEITNDSFFFGRAFYGLGLLAKKTAGQYEVQFLEDIINKISTSETPLSRVVVENLIRSLSYLSQETKLNGLLSSNLLNKLLAILCDSKIDKYHTIPVIFYSLRMILNRHYLEGNLAVFHLEELIRKLADFQKLSKNSINSVFSLLEILEQIDDDLNLNCLELLLQKYSLNNRGIEFGDIFFSLGKLIDAKKAKGTLSTKLVDDLANCFDYKKASAYEIADFIFGYAQVTKQLAIKPNTPLLTSILTEYISLKDQTTADGKFIIESLVSLQVTISWEILETFVKLAMREPSLKPLCSAELYLNLKQFKNHSQLLQPYYTKLENAFTPHLNKLPTKITEELARHVKPNAQPKKNSPLLVRAIKKIPSPIQSPTLTRPRIFKNQPLPQTELQKQLAQANKNEIYKTIAEKNIRKLLKILNLPLTVLNESTPKAHSENHSISHSKSSGKKEYTAIEKLIIDFFKHTGRAAFQHLLNNSKASYFYCLFKACSLPVLFELAKSGELHSLMVNLPFGELKELIPKLISPLQLYRDHHSLLNLIDGLTLRGYKHPQEQQELKRLKSELMEKGVDYHSRSKHVHVMQLLNSCIVKINKGDLIYPDNQFYKRTLLATEEKKSLPSVANKLATRGIFAHSPEKVRRQVTNPTTNSLSLS